MTFLLSTSSASSVLLPVWRLSANQILQDVGTTCVDKYEASVWSVTDSGVIAKIKDGSVTLADLNAAGATQQGAITDNYNCDDNGNDCTDLYAASVPGVTPSATLAWFQAQQFCRAAGKRLLTNAEWQSAAAGTPDPGSDNGSTDCNVDSVFTTMNTGSRSSCVSNAGAFDMVGNLYEWVGDWIPPATSSAPALFETGDDNSMTIDPTAEVTRSGPAALLRGGGFFSGTDAGVFAVFGFNQPGYASGGVGVRCAR